AQRSSRRWGPRTTSASTCRRSGRRRSTRRPRAARPWSRSRPSACSCSNGGRRRDAPTPRRSRWSARVAPAAERARSIMLVAGEASGDLHGATLARALRAAAPGARLYGMGGRRMAAEGVELLVDVTAAATMGGTEAVGGVPGLYRAYRRLRAVVTGPDRPDPLVVIDFPEFNLPLARAARRAGVAGVLPMMRAAAGRIVGAHPDARFLVARAPTVDAAELGDEGGPPLRIVGGRTYTVMRAADLLLVTSGTATLEAALLGTPMVVCYRLSRLSELLFKPLVRVPWISLANIALGRAVVPELYQRALTGEALGRAALHLLDSPAALAGQREAFGELAGQL